jgi:hypothetical protein
MMYDCVQRYDSSRIVFTRDDKVEGRVDFKWRSDVHAIHWLYRSYDAEQEVREDNEAIQIAKYDSSALANPELLIASLLLFPALGRVWRETMLECFDAAMERLTQDNNNYDMMRRLLM